MSLFGCCSRKTQVEPNSVLPELKKIPSETESKMRVLAKIIFLDVIPTGLVLAGTYYLMTINQIDEQAAIAAAGFTCVLALVDILRRLLCCCQKTEKEEDSDEKLSVVPVDPIEKKIPFVEKKGDAQTEQKKNPTVGALDLKRVPLTESEKISGQNSARRREEARAKQEKEDALKVEKKNIEDDKKKLDDERKRVAAEKQELEKKAKELENAKKSQGPEKIVLTKDSFNEYAKDFFKDLKGWLLTNDKSKNSGEKAKHVIDQISQLDTNKLSDKGLATTLVKIKTDLENNYTPWLEAITTNPDDTSARKVFSTGMGDIFREQLAPIFKILR